MYWLKPPGGAEGAGEDVASQFQMTNYSYWPHVPRDKLREERKLVKLTKTGKFNLGHLNQLKQIKYQKKLKWRDKMEVEDLELWDTQTKNKNLKGSLRR
jgi:hypothetical protein